MADGNLDGGIPVATVSSFDIDYHGEAALEMLFHEGAHNPGTLRSFRQALDQAFEKAGKTTPRPLLHVIHFFNVGEIARAEAAKLGISHVPYAEAQELYDGSWAIWRELLIREWLPYLEGRSPREKAREALLAGAAASETK